MAPLEIEALAEEELLHTILWTLHDVLGFPDVLEVAVVPDDGGGLVVCGTDMRISRLPMFPILDVRNRLLDVISSSSKRLAMTFQYSRVK